VQFQDHTSDSSEALVRMLERIVATGRPITPAAEAEVQQALSLLRREGGNPDLLYRLEQISVALIAAAQARRLSRLNLYASQMRRIKR
jgi:hypothetical protein